MIFWTEYANEITGAASLLGIVLLLVALHKIKLIGVQLKKMAGEQTAAVVQVLADDTVEAEEVQPAQAAAAAAAEADDAPEELLDAVLGEVFS